MDVGYCTPRQDLISVKMDVADQKLLDQGGGESLEGFEGGFLNRFFLFNSGMFWQFFPMGIRNYRH